MRPKANELVQHPNRSILYNLIYIKNTCLHALKDNKVNIRTRVRHELNKKYF